MTTRDAGWKKQMSKEMYQFVFRGNVLREKKNC